MPRDPEPTRRKLIDAAARLFAQRGVKAVSQAEIVKASGSRNNAALYYHFRNRDGILRAVLDRHAGVVRARRLELLAKAGDDADLRALVDAYVRPVAELTSLSWRERAYVQINADVIADPSRSTEEVASLLAEAEAPLVFAAIADRCGDLPPVLRTERLALATRFIAHALAERARVVKSRRRRRRLTDDEFAANLVDMVVAALAAPVSVVELSAAVDEAPVGGTAR